MFGGRGFESRRFDKRHSWTKKLMDVRKVIDISSQEERGGGVQEGACKVNSHGRGRKTIGEKHPLLLSEEVVGRSLCQTERKCQ